MSKQQQMGAAAEVALRWMQGGAHWGRYLSLGGSWEGTEPQADRLNKGIHIKVSFRRWLVRKLLRHGRDEHSWCPLETAGMELWVHNSYTASDNIRLAVLKLGEGICYTPGFFFFCINNGIQENMHSRPFLAAQGTREATGKTCTGFLSLSGN